MRRTKCDTILQSQLHPSTRTATPFFNTERNKMRTLNANVETCYELEKNLKLSEIRTVSSTFKHMQNIKHFQASIGLLRV